MKTFKLHLIRHGVTAGNLQGLYIGSGTDIPLCDEGRAQLKELKERFEYPQVDTVFLLAHAACGGNGQHPVPQRGPHLYGARSAGGGLGNSRTSP